MADSNKFLRELAKLDGFFRRHRIAQLESYVLPDFMFKPPQYAEATFTIQNGELFERIIEYMNRECLSFENPISIKTIEDEENSRYTIIFAPLKDAQIDRQRGVLSEKPYWLMQTEEFLTHAAARAENYERTHKH